MAGDSDQQQQDGGQPDGGQPAGVSERMTRIEDEQKEQRGILERVLAAVSGGGSPKGTAGSAPPSSDGGGGEPIADQVRRGVEAIEKEKQRKADEQAAKDADQAWRASVEERLPEQKPAEPAPSGKARLQWWLVGKP